MGARQDDSAIGVDGEHRAYGARQRLVYCGSGQRDCAEKTKLYTSQKIHFVIRAFPILGGGLFNLSPCRGGGSVEHIAFRDPEARLTGPCLGCSDDANL